MPEPIYLGWRNLIQLETFSLKVAKQFYIALFNIYHSIGTIGSGIIQYKSTVSVGNSNLQSDMVVAASVKDGKILC